MQVYYTFQQAMQLLAPTNPTYSTPKQNKQIQFHLTLRKYGNNYHFLILLTTVTQRDKLLEVDIFKIIQLINIIQQSSIQPIYQLLILMNNKIFTPDLDAYSNTFNTKNQDEIPVTYKIIQLRKNIESLEHYKNNSLAQIFDNLLSTCVVPQFDARINYHSQFINWNNLYQVERNINFSFMQIIKDLQKVIQQIQSLISRKQLPQKKQSIKKSRRIAVEIKRNFACPYDDCFKLYGSDVSLNLHIKIKHKGGNKNERQKHALDICEAQLKGLAVPQSELVFPPGYLQSYRQRFKSKYRFYSKI